MPTKDAYNKIAEAWHQDHQQDDWWVEGTDTFISLLKPGTLVLDAGCGAGTKSQYLLDHGLSVIGIDFAEAMIDIAKREVPNTSFLVHDLYDIATLPHQFDGIFIQAALLHIPKSEATAVVANATKALKQNGYFYIAVKETKSDGTEEEVKTEEKYRQQFQRFFSYFTVGEIKEYLEQAGLTIIYEDVHRSGGINWVQVIGRKR